jgi:23S rRNA pseudouridine1911/1915/1917 synthase
VTAISGYVFRHHVRPQDAGASVLDYHVARFGRLDRAAWELELDEGRVQRNGRRAQAAECLREGDLLEYFRAAWSEPEAPLGFEVRFEDEHLLVVDKPANLQVLPAGEFFEHTLLWQVRQSERSRADSSPVHRLGRGTSGLILFGKSGAARAELTRQFRTFALRKTYLAWAQGSCLPNSCIARQALERVAHGPLHIHIASAHGKACKTRVRVLRRESARILVAAQPITGRPDQIRVHLAALGAALVGDPLFGVGGGVCSSLPPGAGGYQLHAGALSFRHPSHGGWIKVRSLPTWI